jgi:hypothetical protein
MYAGYKIHKCRYATLPKKTFYFPFDATVKKEGKVRMPATL